MSRQQRLKAKAKPPERVDSARQREAEGLRAVIGRSKGMVLGGVAVMLVGCLLSAATESDLILWIFSLPGMVLSIVGYVINIRRAKCPGCGGFLGAMPSIARKLPENCPHCGRKW